MNPDHFFTELELYKSGNAPKLIFKCGKMLWDNAYQTEGHILGMFALEYCITSRLSFCYNREY